MKISTFCVFLNLLSIGWLVNIVLLTTGVVVYGLDTTMAILMLVGFLGFGVTCSLREYYEYKVWCNKQDRRNRYYSLQKD